VITVRWGALALAVTLNAPQLAHSYPTRPIRFILPVAAGSTSDTLGRLIAKEMSEYLGQPLVIDNQPGAGGNLGVPIAARAAPDGHTLLLVSSAQAISPGLYPKLGYDLQRDFAAVTQLTAGQYMLVVHPSVPARSVQELVALARRRPGQLLYGSAGIGTGTHLAGELFKAAAGVELLHVPYRGMGPATSELLGGQLAVIFSGLPSGLPHWKSGRVRALGVTSTSRSPAAPELPTLAESGLTGFEATTWQGLAVPAKTPAPIVQRLKVEADRALRATPVHEKLAALGADAVGSTPEQFATYIRSETVKWGRLVERIGLRLD